MMNEEVKTMQPTLYMLVGLPGTGKSTWIMNYAQLDSNTVVLSSDYYVGTLASAVGMTYSEGFKQFISPATELLEDDLVYAVENNLSIYWDQTNLTESVRAERLKKIPAHYRKVAIVFNLPVQDGEWKRRLDRPGKVIPHTVIAEMMNSYREPTHSEGFDEIRYIYS
jgi:tRNA uridine 5-carbamoylmethylation protein Kti12